jgi:transposase
MENIEKARHELSIEVWERLRPLFQKILGNLWRTRQEKDRVVLNGILWILATGAPWRDLPEKYGYWNSVYQRFKRWCDLGLWEKILTELSKDKDPESVMMDGSVIRAHQHAAGAKGGNKIRLLGVLAEGSAVKFMLL